MLDSFRRRNLGFEGLVTILILILCVGLLAYKARNDQWNVWKANPDLTFYNGSPLLSTAVSSIPFVGWVAAGWIAMFGGEQGSNIGGDMAENLNKNC